MRKSSWQFLFAANFIGSIRWHNPEKPPIDAKISQMSLAEAEL